MLKVLMEFRKGVMFVRLYGVLNDSTMDIFNKEVKEVITEAGLKYVVLNIYNLKEISKEGVKKIKALKSMLKKLNGEFFLYGGEFKELKRLVNIENELNVFERVVI